MSASPSGIQSKGAYPVVLIPILAPAPMNDGELPDTLDRQNERLSGCSCTSVNVPELTAAGSTTAGRRCDSCPTCPSEILNLSGLQPHDAQPFFRALDPI